MKTFVAPTIFPAVTLSDLIQQTRFASPAHEAVLNVFATSSWVMSEIQATLAPHGITQAQFNVLRILRGRHPEPYTCSQIAERLLDRTPDVTRLLVRLERNEWVDRQRDEHDRRVVRVAITEKGLDLLSTLDGPVSETIDRIAEPLTDDELTQLSALLERLRLNQV